MKIEFIQTEEHIMDFQKAHFAKIFWLKGLIIFVVVMMLINLFFPLILNGFSWDRFLPSFIPLIVIGLVWWFTLKIIRKRLSQGKNKDLMIGNRIVEFKGDSVFYKTNISETTYQWDAFSKTHVSKLSYLLYLGSNQAIIIPKSAFENENQKLGFEKMIKEKIQ